MTIHIKQRAWILKWKTRRGPFDLTFCFWHCSLNNNNSISWEAESPRIEMHLFLTVKRFLQMKTPSKVQKIRHTVWKNTHLILQQCFFLTFFNHCAILHQYFPDNRGKFGLLSQRWCLFMAPLLTRTKQLWFWPRNRAGDPELPSSSWE